MVIYQRVSRIEQVHQSEDRCGCFWALKIKSLLYYYYYYNCETVKTGGLTLPSRWGSMLSGYG